MKLRLIGEGTRPLLMHNVQLASPMNKYAKELSRLNKAKPSSKRTDEDRLEIAKIEWEGGLYFEPEIGPYVPASWIFKSLLEGARSGRRGQKIEGGVTVVEMIHPLIYKGPRDIAGMWGDNGTSEFVDFRTVRVGQAKVDRCRPIFRQWAFEAELLIDPTVIDPDEVADIANISGRLKGMGDYRQQYGRFEATIERL
jgi:hypothetical protein